MFQATIDDEFIHTLQHLSFLVSALFFGWAAVHSRRSLMGYGAAVLYVFTTSVHSGVLGALITFASALWYPAYAATTSAWGLTALEDQQLGGLIMWVPAAIVYTAIGLWLFAAWLGDAERRARIAWSLRAPRTASTILVVAILAGAASSAAIGCGHD